MLIWNHPKKEALMGRRIVKFSKKAKEKCRERVDSVKERPDLARELLLEGQILVDDLIMRLGTHFLEGVMVADAEKFAGPRYQRGKSYNWWGKAEKGVLPTNEGPIPVIRPRLRSKESGEEAELPLWNTLKDPYEYERRIKHYVLSGMSSRNMEIAYDDCLRGNGLSKSSSSRHFGRAAQKDLDKILNRSLDKEFVGLIIDGVYGSSDVGSLVSIGVTNAGEKIVSGIFQIASENNEVVYNHLSDLEERGFKRTEGFLVVEDGSKGLKKGVQRKWPGVNIQRCVIHKRRNLKKILPDKYHGELDRLYNQMIYSVTYREAQAAYRILLNWLKKVNLQAANSLEEAGEDIITLQRIEFPTELWRSFQSTNILEAAISRYKSKIRRVTKWHGSTHFMRWTASVLLLAEKNFRRVPGWKNIEIYVEKGKAKMAVDKKMEIG
jgi:putative transposase